MKFFFEEPEQEKIIVDENNFHAVRKIFHW
ncbi:hypothetical protein DOJK_01525 [Patescibacteria group bacterium]|nr:hypothetical protein DOJK_01525 [Patescibacteria group bacterium]